MSTHIYRIVLAAILSLNFEVAFAATITGAQCKEHFQPLMTYMFNVDHSDELKYVSAHTGPVTVKTETNTYVSNIVDAPLSSTLKRIENLKTDNTRVLSLQRLIKKTLDDCHKHCQGLALNNERFVKCNMVPNDTPLNVRLGLARLENGTVAELKEPEVAPDAREAFEFQEIPVVAVESEVKEAITTSVSPLGPKPDENEEEIDDLFYEATLF